MATEPKMTTTIRIPTELIDRIDKAASLRGDSRNVVMERILANGIESEERFNSIMENPIASAIVTMLAKPAVMGTMAKLLSEGMTAEELKHIKDEAERQAGRGRDRRSAKKTSKKTSKKLSSIPEGA